MYTGPIDAYGQPRIHVFEQLATKSLTRLAMYTGPPIDAYGQPWIHVFEPSIARMNMFWLTCIRLAWSCWLPPDLCDCSARVDREQPHVCYLNRLCTRRAPGRSGEPNVVRRRVARAGQRVMANFFSFSLCECVVPAVGRPETTLVPRCRQTLSLHDSFFLHSLANFAGTWGDSPTRFLTLEMPHS